MHLLVTTSTLLKMLRSLGVEKLKKLALSYDDLLMLAETFRVPVEVMKIKLDYIKENSKEAIKGKFLKKGNVIFVDFR